MSYCRNCDRLLYAGLKPFQVDKLVCRECQKNPAVQLRILLDDARRRGLEFEEAYGLAVGAAPDYKDSRIRWPHDTAHRQDWKRILASEKTREVWRRAYDREPSTERQKTLQHLAIAA